MRRILVSSLSLLCLTAAVIADDAVPQDRNRMEAQRREGLAWNRETMLEAYQKVGKKDRRWDEAATRALENAAEVFNGRADSKMTFHDIYVPAKHAVDSGCDDPLILYLYARAGMGDDYPGDEEAIRRMQEAADALKGSAYPRLRRAVALVRAAAAKAALGVTPESRPQIEKELSEVLELAVQDAKTMPKPEEWKLQWVLCLSSAYEVYKTLGLDPPAACKTVDQTLSKAPELNAIRLTLRGNIFMQWAWKARGLGFAGAVTDRQFQTFGERLKESKKALDEAWKDDPDQPRLASIRLDLEKALGTGDRQSMETWFRRAMLADGNDQGACWTKLDWLDPKWYGDSYEDMINFGKACAATGNWHNGITLIVADAHYRKFSSLQGLARVAYLAQPSVWKEIEPVYEEYLKHYPENYAQMSKYAALCFYSQHIRRAHELFQTLGDNLTTWGTFPYIPVQSMKIIRKQTADLIASHPEL